MCPAKAPRPVSILLVERDPGNAQLILEVLQATASEAQVWWVKDGREAIDLLLERDVHIGVPYPDFILLDLDLSDAAGMDVLVHIKSHDVLHRIPVVILRTAIEMEEVGNAYRLGANCLVQKPLDPDRLRNVISVIEKFWLSTVSLPPRLSGQPAARCADASHERRRQ